MVQKKKTDFFRLPEEKQKEIIAKAAALSDAMQEETLRRAEAKSWEDLYPLNTFRGETKRELLDFFRAQIAAEKDRIKRQVQRDLDAGKFCRICSSERSFKEYLLDLIKAGDGN